MNLALPSASFEMTCLRVKRLLLMAMPSWALFPTAPVALSLSEPARSTRFWVCVFVCVSEIGEGDGQREREILKCTETYRRE